MAEQESPRSTRQWILWRGRVTTRGRQLATTFGFISAGFGWMGAFVILPMLAMLVLAFLSRGPQGEILWDFTVENYRRVLGYGLFGWSADNLVILGRSVAIAFLTTVFCVVLAYPLAFWIAARPPRTRYLWLALVVVPLCTNLVIRAYAWMLILSPSLPPATMAQWLGLVAPGAALYPSILAVYLGMVTSALPFAVLPIYTNVERIDWSVVEACRDLYCSSTRVFRHGILPQTVPGLQVAVMLTFVPSLGMFVIPDLLGGAKYWLVGNLIQQQFGSSRDWPFGAALSLVLIGLTLIGLLGVWRYGKKAELV